MSRKKVATTIYITAEQDRQLKLLSQATGMPMAELIRQGIDHVLDVYKDRLPAQLGLFGEVNAPLAAEQVPPKTAQRSTITRRS